MTQPFASRRRSIAVIAGFLSTFAACFILTGQIGEAAAADAFHRFGMIPAVLLGDAQLSTANFTPPAFLTLVTAQFLHGDAVHLIANAAVFGLFGRSCAVFIGPAPLSALFLLSGALGLFAEACVDPAERTPILGASAGASGLVGGALLLKIRIQSGRWRTGDALFIGLAAVWVGAPILLDATGALTEVPHVAHSVGLIVGAALAPRLARRG